MLNYAWFQKLIQECFRSFGCWSVFEGTVWISVNIFFIAEFIIPLNCSLPDFKLSQKISALLCAKLLFVFKNRVKWQICFSVKVCSARLVFSVSVQDTGKYITSNPLLFLGTLDQSLGKYEKQNHVDGRCRSSEVEYFVKTCQPPTNETVIMNNSQA